MNFVSRRHAQGFSLIEVLVAVVILSVGLLALASLQISLIRASADAKAQTTALALAKQKLEDMRSYTNLAGYIGLTDPADETLANVGGVDFTRKTVVERYVLNAATGNYVNIGDTAAESTFTTGGNNYTVGRDFKRVAVSVTWVSATLAAGKVAVEDIIDGLDPTDATKISKNSSGFTPRNTEVIIANPASEAGVIPIAIDPSNSKSTAATNPRPVVDQGGNETRFDVLTYSALNDTTALAQARVETTVAACTCDTNNVTATTGYRPTYWNGYRYIAPTLANYTASAQHANLANKVYESPYCDQCCRDHQDPSTLASSSPKFDPWRTAHTHYGQDSNGNLVAVGTNGQKTYLEACRLIRVDGIYRVAADFNDEYMNLLQTVNDGSTLEYIPTSTAATYYQTFVLAYLDGKVISNSSPTTYNNALSSGSITSLENTNHINDPASITMQRTADHKWLHNRGLYIDYLEPEALAAIATAKANCVTTNCSPAEKQVAVLSLMPFTTINVSELTQWTPVVAGGSPIEISDGSFYDTAASTVAPVRGYVTPAASIPSGAQTVNGTATMLTSNSGLVTRTAAIDTDEVTKTDIQVFAIPAGTPVGKAGTITVNFSGYDLSNYTPVLSGTNLTNCSKISGRNIVTYYACTVSSVPTTPFNLTVNSYNQQLAAANGLPIFCDGPSGTKPYTTGGGDTKLVQCANYSLDSATSNRSGVIGVPISPLNPNVLAESTMTPFTSVNDTDILGLTFSGPALTFAGYTCTYTALKSGSPDKPTINATNATCP